MRFGEFKRASQEHLDEILVRLCAMVVNSQRKDPDPKGGRMVAATIYDPQGQTSLAISNQRKDGSWNHAERNAIDQYIKEFGSIPEGSIIVTTLSPCGDQLNTRYGESCVDLINQHPAITKAYCGYDDHTQSTDRADFKVEITANRKIKELCEMFANRVTSIKENMDHSKDGQAVDELKSALIAHQDRLQQASDDQVYDIIDSIMTRIARSHSISGQKLHDMWVKRYKEIPDTWIMNQQLDELSFLGSPCTKDCSGHRAGYAWSQSKGGRVAQSPFSPSFNNGSQLHVDGK